MSQPLARHQMCDMNGAQAPGGSPRASRRPLRSAMEGTPFYNGNKRVPGAGPHTWQSQLLPESGSDSLADAQGNAVWQALTRRLGAVPLCYVLLHRCNTGPSFSEALR